MRNLKPNGDTVKGNGHKWKLWQGEKSATVKLKGEQVKGGKGGGVQEGNGESRSRVAMAKSEQGGGE